MWLPMHMYVSDIPILLFSQVHTSFLSSLLLCCVWWQPLKNLVNLGNLSAYPEAETVPFEVRRKTSVCLPELCLNQEPKPKCAGSMEALWLGSSEAWICPESSIEIQVAIEDAQIGRLSNSAVFLGSRVWWALLVGFFPPFFALEGDCL